MLVVEVVAMVVDVAMVVVDIGSRCALDVAVVGAEVLVGIVSVAGPLAEVVVILFVGLVLCDDSGNHHCC